MKRLKSALGRVASDYSSHGCVTHGAALAFYALFALLPVPIFVVSLAARVIGSDVAGPELIDAVRALGGHQMAETIGQALESASELTTWRGAHLFGLASLVFGSTAFFVELQEVVNKIWGVAPTSVRWSSLVRSRFTSFVTVGLSGFALLVLTLFGAAVQVFGEKLHLAMPFPVTTSRVAGTLGSLLVLALLFSLLFRYLPDTRVAFREVWLGSLGTAVLILCGNGLLGLYLRHSRLATAYGAAGSLVLTLSWVYYSSLAFLLGAEVTRHLGRRSASVD